MKQFIRTIALAASLLLTATTCVIAHSDRGENRPQTYAEAFIPWTKQELRNERRFRHPPGNVRAEDMHALFSGTVVVIDRGGKFSTVPGVVNHALKFAFIGKDGRYVWCSYGNTSDYYHRDDRWAPVKVKHAGTLSHRFDPAIHNDRPNGLSLSTMEIPGRSSGIATVTGSGTHGTPDMFRSACRVRSTHFARSFHRPRNSASV